MVLTTVGITVMKWTVAIIQHRPHHPPRHHQDLHPHPKVVTRTRPLYLDERRQHLATSPDRRTKLLCTETRDDPPYELGASARRCTAFHYELDEQSVEEPWRPLNQVKLAVPLIFRTVTGLKPAERWRYYQAPSANGHPMVYVAGKYPQPSTLPAACSTHDLEKALQPLANYPKKPLLAVQAEAMTGEHHGTWDKTRVGHPCGADVTHPTGNLEAARASTNHPWAVQLSSTQNQSAPPAPGKRNCLIKAARPMFENPRRQVTEERNRGVVWQAAVSGVIFCDGVHERTVSRAAGSRRNQLRPSLHA
ncbi:hypothetical protein HPB51_029578 [Rhipicephalus microplus]|uniref:Uncharacterized protein n=1 Tax=Rhipicephalus microplus TaxID=6941 RepID=A0A9J6CTM3_RHIMP|nr:hypothetical protein HPB51_029578 [Rhipicephalus microplus]